MEFSFFSFSYKFVTVIFVFGVPDVVKSSLFHTKAENCFVVADVEVERLQEAPSLQEVDLRENPLNSRSHSALQLVTTLRIHISPRQIEDWEDLTV
jgi:hypothetical protein